LVFRKNHRYCEYCLQPSALGDETHIFLKCPTTASLASETVDKIQKKLRLFDVPPWSSFTDTQRVSILLGNPPPSLLKKYTKEWMQECVPLLHTYATELRSLLGSLLPPPPSESEDVDSDELLNPGNCIAGSTGGLASAHTRKHTYIYTHTHTHIRTCPIAHIGNENTSLCTSPAARHPL